MKTTDVLIQGESRVYLFQVKCMTARRPCQGLLSADEPETLRNGKRGLKTPGLLVGVFVTVGKSFAKGESFPDVPRKMIDKAV